MHANCYYATALNSTTLLSVGIYDKLKECRVESVVRALTVQQSGPGFNLLVYSERFFQLLLSFVIKKKHLTSFDLCKLICSPTLVSNTLLNNLKYSKHSNKPPPPRL